MMELVALLFLVFKITWEDVREFYIKAILIIPVGLVAEILKKVAGEQLMTVAYLATIMVFVKLVFRKKTLMSVFIALFSWVSVIFLQMLFMGIMFLAGYEIVYEFHIGIRVMISTVLSSILIYLFIPLHKVTEAVKARKALVYILIPTSALLMGAVYYLRSQHRQTVWVNYELLAIFLLVILVGHYVVHRILKAKARADALKKFKKINDKDYIDYSVNEEMYNDHIFVVQLLSRMENDEITTDFIEKRLNNMEGPEELTFALPDVKLINVKRKSFAAYLFLVMSWLKSSGVNCWLNIYDFSIASKVNDDTLIEMLSILLDNAAEAVEENERDKNPDKSVRDMYVTINKENGKATIEILNRWDGEVTIEMIKEGYTTKKDSDGLGLYKLQKILTDNNCSLVIENKKMGEEKYASFKIIL